MCVISILPRATLFWHRRVPPRSLLSDTGLFPSTLPVNPQTSPNMKAFTLLLTFITFILCTGAVPCSPKKAAKCPNLIRNASFSGKGNKPWRYHDKGASALRSHNLKEFAQYGYTSV